MAKPAGAKAPLAIPNISRRTKRRGMLLSLFVGLLTLVVGFLNSPHKKLVSMVMTNTSLPAGTIVSAHDVSVTAIPAPGVPGALPTLSDIVGKKLAQPVVAHQPLMSSDLVATRLLQGLAPGEVGVMLPVSLASSDNVRPGDRVTVIWLGSGNNGTSSTTASSGTSGSMGSSPAALPPGSVLAQGLRVLSVLNNNGGPVQSYNTGGLNASTPASVELAVPSYEAGPIAVAADSGRFWLALTPWSTSPNGAVTATTPVVHQTPNQPPAAHHTTSQSVVPSSLATHSGFNTPGSTTSSTGTTATHTAHG